MACCLLVYYYRSVRIKSKTEREKTFNLLKMYMWFLHVINSVNNFDCFSFRYWFIHVTLDAFGMENVHLMRETVLRTVLTMGRLRI